MFGQNKNLSPNDIFLIKRALQQATKLSGFNLMQQTYLQPTKFMEGRQGTKDHLPCSCSWRV